MPETAPHPDLENQKAWIAPDDVTEEREKALEYIERHTEKPKFFEAMGSKTARSRLRRESEREYQGRKIETRIGSLEISVEYQPQIIERTLSTGVIKSIDREKSLRNVVRSELSRDDEDSEEFRILKELRLRNSETGEELNILDGLPEEYQIIAKTSGKVEGSAAYVKEKYCVIREDLLTVGGVLATLHEIGHCRDYENQDPGKKEDWRNARKAMNEPGENAEQAMAAVLRHERNAWAYALKTAKPFIKQTLAPNAPDDIRKVVHNICLYGYSSAIEKQMKTLPLRRVLAKRNELTEETTRQIQQLAI